MSTAGQLPPGRGHLGKVTTTPAAAIIRSSGAGRADRVLARRCVADNTRLQAVIQRRLDGATCLAATGAVRAGTAGPGRGSCLDSDQPHTRGNHNTTQCADPVIC